MSSESIEHVVNPAGRRLTDTERAYRTALVEEHEKITATEDARRRSASAPAASRPFETRLTEGHNGELVRDDGTVVEHEPGAEHGRRTMPRVGDGPYGVDALMHAEDGGGTA